MTVLYWIWDTILLPLLVGVRVIVLFVLPYFLLLAGLFGCVFLVKYFGVEDSAKATILGLVLLFAIMGVWIVGALELEKREKGSKF